MAVFVRPATWSYDLELFRRATDDEDRLEAMLAAIALADQGLWVVESNQRPVAFAWTEVRRETVRLPLLHVEPGEEPSELLPPLMSRIEDEYCQRHRRLELAAESIQGVDEETLRAVGLRYDGQRWTKRLGATA